MVTLIEDYDVQETRRVARAEGREEGIKEDKIETAINIIKEFKATITKAMAIISLPDDAREQLIRELERQNIPYTND